MRPGYTFYFNGDVPVMEGSLFDREIDLQLQQLHDGIMQKARQGANVITYKLDSELRTFSRKYRCVPFQPNIYSDAFYHGIVPPYRIVTYDDWLRFLRSFIGIDKITSTKSNYGYHFYFHITYDNYFLIKEVIFDLGYLVDMFKPIQAETLIKKIKMIVPTIRRSDKPLWLYEGANVPENAIHFEQEVLEGYYQLELFW